MNKLLGIGVLCMFGVLQYLGILIAMNYKKSEDIYQLFEVIDIKTTQVIEITFQDITTSEQYKINFVKQYCTNWQTIKLGSEWNLPVITNESGKYVLNAHLICGN